jgi:outer membrane lipoprotein-sorting protein
MKKNPIKLIICLFVNLLFLTFLFSFSTKAQPDKAKVFNDLVKKFGKINSIESSFQDETNFSGKCNLKAKKGNKYSINIAGNKIICDGKTIWNYNPKNKNVVISDFSPEIGGITLDYFFFNVLENLEPITLKSQISTKNNNSGQEKYILELQNKDKMSEIKQVNLFINANLKKIDAIEIITSSGNQKWKILNLEINKKFLDADFSFKVPENVEIIDMR